MSPRAFVSPIPRLVSYAAAVLVAVIGMIAGERDAQARPGAVAQAVWGALDEPGQPMARVLVQLDVAQTMAATPAPASIAAAQATLDGEIAGFADVKGSHVTRRFATIPWVAMQVDAAGLAALEGSDVAISVVPDRWARSTLTESVPLVGAPPAWSAGFDGSDWAVAVLDTGADGEHPFLAGKIVSEACFSLTQSCPNAESSQVGPGAAVPCGFLESACSHGTHVAGIVAGRNDEFSGVSRGASIVAVQVFSQVSGAACGNGGGTCALSADSDQIAGLEHVLALRQQFQIAAVNMSLGGDSEVTSQAECDERNPAIKAAIDNLRAAGIATIVASGNEGRTDGTGEPACVSSAIAVGAVSKQDEVATSFSNSAPFLALLAPGVAIQSALSPGPPGLLYRRLSGTSQATPHVAGAFAILRQKKPEASVDEILSVLRSTGLPITDPRNAVTTPRIQIDAALAALGGSSAGASGLQITPDAARTLVSKPVHGEQWAISLNQDDGSATGNIFYPDGRDPKFVACERISDDGNPDPAARVITFSCQGAERCTTSGCPAPGDWTPIGDSVEIPGSFFLPRTAAAAGAAELRGSHAGRVAVITGAGGARASVAPARTAADAPSGLQVTPNGRRTLVSKPVGREQWAITRNADDLTVTGNVFYADGRDPQFLSCTQVGDDENPDPAQRMLTLDCLGADACDTATCPAGEDWQPVALGLELPLSFFLPR